MLVALREKTFVKPGGYIEVHSPDLIPQDEVEVIVVLKQNPHKNKNNETAFMSESALATDWNKPEEDIAWEHLQAEQ